MAQAIQGAGGWMAFDDFMHRALYTPGLGYYANDLRKLGLMPGSGSDFVTAPELSPLFGRALAAQVGEALERTQTDEIWEFGAGSGALALQLLETLGARVRRYTIVDVSGSLRARQQQTLQKFGERVHWATELPTRMQGVLVGNGSSTPCRCSCWCAGTASGTSGVWGSRVSVLSGPTGPPSCARRWTWTVPTTT
jgi:SAM-dependent MidA family methyltransferase